MQIKHTKPWFLTMACVLLVSSGAFGQRAYLVVDRTTGTAEATASTTIPVDGYTISSASGLLNADGWNSIADQGGEGWTEANPTSNLLTELTLTNGGLESGLPISIGSPFTPDIASLPSDEDLSFQISVPNADPTQPGSILDGFVVYTGASPVPTITVNRESGMVELTNSGGFDVDAFSIGSANGLLAADALTAPVGFTPSNSTSNLVTGLNFEGSAAFPSTLSLGTLFQPGGVAAISAEDLTLEYTRPDSTEVFTGVVEYTGAVNDLVLQVNELTGEASIQHLSPNVGSVEVTGYSVLSASDGLDTAAWQRIGGEFTEASPTANAIAELNLNGAFTFSNGTIQNLGTIFSGSSRDLVFEYSTPDVDKAFGSVEYVLGASSAPTCADIAASRAIAGDLDGNGAVAFADFLVLSNSFGNEGVGYEGGDVNCDGIVGFPDFLIVSNNFGQSAGAEAHSVPEPTAGLLAAFGLLMGLALRKQRG